MTSQLKKVREFQHDVAFWLRLGFSGLLLAMAYSAGAAGNEFGLEVASGAVFVMWLMALNEAEAGEKCAAGRPCSRHDERHTGPGPMRPA